MSIIHVSLFICAVLLHWNTAASSEEIIQNIPGDQLDDYVRKSPKTLIFFTRSAGCSACQATAKQLAQVLPSIDIPAFSIEDATVADVYADRVPALVLFIGRTPVLYEGAMEGEAFAEFVSTNPEPRVRILNDESFEHLTQASTGATTGDWLVMFHGLSCEGCKRLESRLQGVAAKLRTRVLVAKVSSQTDGRETAKRLGVNPALMQILFFRQGQMYSYHMRSMDLTSLSAFAIGLYKEAPSRAVPSMPPGPMMLILQVAGALLVLGYILMAWLNRRNQEQQRKEF